MNHTPKSICILRLSSIGDVAHMIPTVHTIQKYWPDTELTWIIGKNEARLVNNLPNIELIEFNKSSTIQSYKKLIRKLKSRKFDILLCAQVSLRANIISTLISARLKIGYDNYRSKDFHSYFVDEQITYTPNQHVLDSFFSFIEHIGLYERSMKWNYNITQESHDFAAQYLDNDKFKIIISPCSSHSLRNWLPDRYAEVADYAAQQLNAQILLCGSPSLSEIKMGKDIEKNMKAKPLNLIGKDNLNKFLALLKGSDVIISPDSGPIHMAAGLGTHALGLYAASNPKRSGPYFSQKWCVDKYNEAAIKYKHKSANKLKWGTKIEYPEVMNLIGVQDVLKKLEKLANRL